MYILKAGSIGGFAGGGIYESVVRENKLFIQEELYGSQGIMQLYQPALLKLNPKKLVFFGNYPEMTFGDGILNTGQIPLNGTKEFYLDFSHTRASKHLDGSNESEKVKIYAKLGNPTKTPITLTLQSALLFGNQDSSYGDSTSQPYMTQVEDLNTNNIKNRGPGLLLAYHRNYSPNKFAGRGIF